MPLFFLEATKRRLLYALKDKYTDIGRVTVTNPLPYSSLRVRAQGTLWKVLCRACRFYSSLEHKRQSRPFALQIVLTGAAGQDL